MIDEEKFAQQRVERGWDETAYWDTCSWLCKHLGAILTYTADRLHGHPMNISAEEWEFQHHKAGAALTRYHAVRDDRHDPMIYEAAQDALRWVADNLENLWD